MLKKVIAAAVVGGTLVLGAAGIAGAATTGSTHPNCSKAQNVVNRVTKLEAKASVWLPKAEQREATAKQNGDTARADRIQKRINRVNALETKANARVQKLEAACPGVTAS